MTPKAILFLTLAEAVEIHSDQIERYGGSPGVRDLGLLSSAIAMPCASFQQEFLHGDVFQMAAAYAFHITRNHPFVDGNKRTGLAAALVFLELNGISVEGPDEGLYEAMMSLASGTLGKDRFAGLLKELCQRPR